MEYLIINFLENTLPNLSWFNYILIIIFGILESIPVFGFFIPGQTIIILYGFASRLGDLSPLLAIIFATSGAFLGDITGYIIGRKYGKSFVEKYGPKFGAGEKHINYVKKLINSNPIKTIILGRIHAFSRSLSPFTSGLCGMNFLKFISISFVSCILWATLSISIGYIFGESFAIAAKALGKFILVGSLFAILVFLVIKQVKKSGYKITNMEIGMCSFNAFCLYIFAHFAETIRNFSPQISRSDLHFYIKISKIINENYTTFMIWISEISDKLYVGIFAIIGISFLILKKKTKDAWLVFSSLLSGVTLVYVLKNFFDRPRPPHPLITESGYSFPSGHSVLAGIVGTFVILLAKKYIISKTKRIIVYVLAITYILLVGFSRLYLRVHFISDVVAGILLGVWVITTLYLSSTLFPWLYKFIRRKQILDKL